MGVPFSHEVQNASHHIDTIAPIVKIALWTIICVSVILSLLIGTLLIAVVALLITVNPDLAEERKRLVTPVLRAWLKVPSMLVGISSIGAAPTREGERSEWSPTAVPEKKTKYRE
jgi:hypothetical protein